MLREAAPNLMGIDAKKAALSKMMPDRLKQYALANSDDLITMSLISQIQSERNKADLARKAQQANASPPKVTQQLAESIPVEESGIAALPAENMTYAAEGGIVGYAEGGVAEEDTTFPEGSMLGMWERYQKKNPNLPLAALFSNAPEYAAMREESQRQKLSGGPTGSVFTPGGESGLRPEMVDGRAQTASTRPGGAPQGIQQVLPRGAPQGRQAPQAAPRAPMAPQQGIEDLYKQAQKMAGAGTQADPDAAVRSEILANRQAQAERERADAEQRAQGLESILKPREERITQREAALEKQGQIDRSMAIINAGLAMMQSTGAGLSGIAEGAAKGMKQYGESMALSKAEQQKISDARDAYDELKLNAKNMSQKELTAARNKIDEAANISKESGIAAAQKRYDTNQKTAETLFGKAVDATTAAQNRASQEKIAGMQIAATQTARAQGLGDREVQMAEAAFARDPEAAAIKKTLEAPMYTMGASAAERSKPLLERLRKIQEDKYRQFGATLQPSPGATAPASTPGANTRMKFDAKGNPI